MTLLHEINIDDKEDPLRLVPSFEFSQDPVPNENRQKEFHFTPQLPHLRGSAHHRIRNPSQQDAEPILISHSCLLIPMFLAAWWYYTKQCIRKVSGLLRNCPEPHDVAKENFHEKFFRFNDANVQWDDILDDSKSGTRTDRLVKWINRRNVRRRHAKKEMRQTTERVLGQPSVDDARLKNVQKLVMRSSSCDDSSRLSHPLTHQPSAQWECISDMGEIELCAMNSSVAEGEESFRMDTSTRDKFMPAVQESVSGSHSLDETSQSDDAKGVSVYV